MPKYLYTYWREGLNEMFKLKKYTSIQGYSLDGFRDPGPDSPHIWHKQYLANRLHGYQTVNKKVTIKTITNT